MGRARRRGRRTVLLISQTTPLPARRRTWQQAAALLAAGWEVHALCPRRGAAPRRETVDGITIHRFRAPPEFNGRAGILLEYLAALLSIGWNLSILVPRIRPGVVQVTSPPDWLVLLAWPARLFGIRVAIDIADLCPELYAVKFGARGPLPALVRSVSGLSYRLSDIVIVANATIGRAARARGARAAPVVLHSFLPRARTVRRRPPGDGIVTFGWFGIVGHQDSVETLIRAFSMMRARPRARLVVVGDGPALEAARRLARERGRGDIRFTGFLEGDRLAQALAGFDIGTIPDQPNAYTRTITPNKAFHYAALALPVVATPLEGLGDVLGESVRYAASGTAEDLAAAMDDALGTIGALSRSAAGNAERLQGSWERECAGYVAAFDALVGGSPLSG